MLADSEQERELYTIVQEVLCLPYLSESVRESCRFKKHDMLLDVKGNFKVFSKMKLTE